MKTYVLRAATLPELQAKIDRVKREYHPAGYGTTFRKPMKLQDASDHTQTYWIASGYRFDHCD